MSKRFFSGPVELSEFPTSGSKAPFIGTRLRLVFQVTKDLSAPDNGVFPEIRVTASRVTTYQEWQQHTVRLNGQLIGTIDRPPDAQAATPGSHVFSFPFDPRLLRVDPKTPPHEPWKLPLSFVNTLDIELGAAGFGLNDSFELEYIDFENLE